MKRAVFIIAPVNFRDEELFETKEIVEKAGVSVTIACSVKGTAKGKFGSTARPDMLLKDVNVSDYDAVVFIGGGGAAIYLDDPAAHRIAHEAIKQNKILGAICMAPAILARAGVLKGKKATVFPDDAKELTMHGATYTGKTVEKDGQIITGCGPEAATEFGQALAKELTTTSS
ncbi:MAG: DJ-1/PfpI family protein [Candidatus Omnitrophica bacterium]|jgi:protease I|nr:DJ-1/PfpI family protein [Candidatus Omnitrophota bacterium]